MNQTFWCDTCKTGKMSTQDQLTTHLQSQKHIKKAFNLGVDINWDGHSTKDRSQSTTIIVNQFNVPSMNSDQDFPSLGGGPATNANGFKGFGRGRGRGAAIQPQCQLKSSYDGTDSNDFPTLGSSAPSKGNKPGVSYGAAVASGATMNSSPVSAPSADVASYFEPTRENPAYKTGNVQLVSQISARPTKVKPMDADYEKKSSALRILKEYDDKTKTPLQAYEEITKCMRWEVKYEECAPLSMPYAMKIILHGREVGKAEGKKKQEAKHKAAQQALKEVKRILKDTDEDDACSHVSHENGPADQYADMTEVFIKNLVKRIKGLERPSAYAAFIITTKVNEPAHKGVIVALGTGRDVTKLTKSNISDDHGYHLTDMQSLTMARRALQCFLWSQINRLFNESDMSVMMGDSSDVSLFFTIDSKGWIVLKPEHRLHLFMSHAPVGDATAYISENWVEPSILPANEVNRDNQGKLMPQAHCQRSVSGKPHLGILRIMKHERGCTVPVNFTGGLLESPCPNIVSPSDKLMRWIHLGLQGSLLSHFMKPFHLYSIQMGCQYHHPSIARALLTRVNLTRLSENSEDYLPDALVDPFITRSKTLRAYPRAERKVSWSWFMKNRDPNNPGVEVVDTDTGLISPEFDQQHANNNSLLSRYSMLTRFQMVSDGAMHFYANKPVLSRGRELRATLQAVEWEYASLKKLASNYQMAKESFISAVKCEGLGEWPSNFERQSFCLSDE